MGDTKGALQSYTWFDQIFPDDSDDPLHLLCWTLVLYRMGAWNQAEAKLRQTMLSNLYLVPHVLGIEQGFPVMWHPSSLTVKSYLACIPESIFAYGSHRRGNGRIACITVSQCVGYVSAISRFIPNCKRHRGGQDAVN